MKKTAFAVCIMLIASIVLNPGIIALANSFTLGGISDSGTISTWTPESTEIATGNVISMKCTNTGKDVSLAIKGTADSDVSEYDYLEWYIDIDDISPNAEFPIVFRVRDLSGSKEYMSTDNKGGTYKLVTSAGAVDKTLDEHGRIVLPAGFTGYVRFPMSVLTAGGMDATKVAEVVVWYGPTAENVGKSIYFKDFRFAKSQGQGADANEGNNSIIQEAKPAVCTEIAFGDTVGTDSATISNISQATIGNGDAYQVTSSAVSGNISFTFDSETGIDASAMKYLEFWLDVSNISPTADFYACFRMYDGYGAASDSFVAYNTNVYFLVDGKWDSYSIDAGGRFAVPAGFCGYVRIPLSSFTNAASTMVGNGNLISLTSLKRFVVWYGASANTVNKKLYVDNFRFVDNQAGDLNGNDVFDVADLVIMKHLVFDNSSKVISDMNGDGVLDVIDVVKLRRLVLGIDSVNGGANGEESEDTFDLIMSWIQWSGGPTRPDGTQSLWDYVAADNAGVNQLSVYYLAKNADGTTVYGVPTNTEYAAVMDIAAYDIEQSDARNIRVIGYVDTVQFAAETASEMGYTLEDICAKRANGDYISTTAWYAAGLYVACINSPEWRIWIAENLRLTAATGFAGIQFDFHPYAGAGLFCHCHNCQAKWAEYSQQKLGQALSLPTSLDFATEVSRVYYQWKMDCFCEFMNEVGAPAKEVNKDFDLLMNNNATGYNFAFEALGNSVDELTSEFVGTDNGNSSTLFLYQMAEALGYKDLYTQYGSDYEISPIYRYKVNIGESLATIGSISYVAQTSVAGSQEVANQAFRFANNHKDAYTGTASTAKTAVVWSVESNLYSLLPNQLDLTALLFNFSTDRARQAAAALLKSGVTYDYLVMEQSDYATRLENYDVLVIPEYTYFNNAKWQPFLLKAKEMGKNIIVIGNAASNYVSTVIPEGAWSVPDFTGVGNEQSLVVSQAFTDALNGYGAKEQITIKNNQSVTAVTSRMGEDALYINVVRRGDSSVLTSLNTSLSIKLPAGFEIDTITAECPFTLNEDIDVYYAVSNGSVDIKTNDFDTYLLITIKKKKQ